MSLTSWNPLTEFDVMRQQMARMFNQMVATGRLLPSLDAARMFMPTVDVYTRDNDVIVTAEIPGVEPQDVTVEVSDQAVHLSGELRRDREICEDNIHRSERQYGHFERVIPLPFRIKDQEAKAAFRNGILTIRVPLAESLRRPRGNKLRIET